MTVDERLREAHAGVPDPDPATVARARARLIAALDEAPAPAPARRRRRRRFTFLVPALALAAAVVAVVVLTGGGEDIEREAPQPAAPGPVSYERNTVASGFRYITADGSPNGNPGNAAYAIAWSMPQEIWRAADGSGRVAYGDESAPYLPSAADERAWRAAGSPDLKEKLGETVDPKVTNYGPGELDPALMLSAGLEMDAFPGRDPLAAAPREPQALAAWLHAAAAKQHPGAPQRILRMTVGNNAVALLLHPLATQEQRLALIGVLSSLDGARKLTSVRDAVGREWPGIQLDLQTIGYDPRTGRLMAQGDRFKGGVRWTHTYDVASGGVSAIGARP
ncbi:hypothetical protein [Solirubrobacter soli]|uniref:hypothetical protein n=1 Tax=Solirubrobacter soli TaxID=363832 RepID=UPI00040A9A7F|nr:hypothetical protein [Solirubrobacter soli]